MDTNKESDSNKEAELDKIVSIQAVEETLGRILNERFTQLLGAGLRYPLTSNDPLKTILLGGYLLFPLVIGIDTLSMNYLQYPELGYEGEMTLPGLGVVPISVQQEYLLPLLLASIPVNGYLIYVVQKTINEKHDPSGFPEFTDWGRWKQLSVVGFKGLIISIICFVAPLVVLSSTLGGITGRAFTQVIDFDSATSAYLLPAVILIYFYPAAIGNFTEQGRLWESIDGLTGPSVFFNRSYLRGVLVIITLLMTAVVMIQVAIELFEFISVIVIGPIFFYFLLSIHYVTGSIWKEISDSSGSPNQIPELDVMRDRSSQADPIAEAFDDVPHVNLDEISSWKIRTRIDRLAVRLYQGIKSNPLVWLSLYLITLVLIQASTLVVFIAYLTAVQPLFPLSFASAFLLTGYIWHRYGTQRTPFRTVMITFVLGMAFATLSINFFLMFMPIYEVGTAGIILFFVLIWVPIQEISKLLAVWIYAYRSRFFNSVIDGAVYGAAAGLGFAVVMNFLLLLGQQFSESGILIEQIVRFTLIIAPLQVLFSAFAGYYLGLAKFNPENAGPIVTKGLLIVIVLRSFYDIAVDLIQARIPAEQTGIVFSAQIDALLIFGIIFIPILMVMLFRKLSAYSTLYRETIHSCAEEDTGSDIEIEPQETTQLEDLRGLLDSGLLTYDEFEELRSRL